MTGGELAGGRAAGCGMAAPEMVDGLLFAAAGLPACANAGVEAMVTSAAAASVRANCFCIKGFRNTLAYWISLRTSDVRGGTTAGERSGWWVTTHHSGLSYESLRPPVSSPAGR